jgi:hypothetical protein
MLFFSTEVFVEMIILSMGVDIRQISVPIDAGVGAIFHLWVRSAPAS